MTQIPIWVEGEAVVTFSGEVASLCHPVLFARFVIRVATLNYADMVKKLLLKGALTFGRLRFIDKASHCQERPFGITIGGMD